MRRGIGVVIGLELDNHAADTIDEQRRADQIGRDFEHGTIEKRPAKARGRHGRTLHIPGARSVIPALTRRPDDGCMSTVIPCIAAKGRRVSARHAADIHVWLTQQDVDGRARPDGCGCGPTS